MPRFPPSGGLAPGEYSRIIQCPEELNLPQEILRTTYSNCTWQDRLLDKAENIATSQSVDDDFAHLLDTRFPGFPERKTVHDIANQPVDMPITHSSTSRAMTIASLLRSLSLNRRAFLSRREVPGTSCSHL
jgi:hypothetical protein